MSNILTIRDLAIGFEVQDSFVIAVDGVSFGIRQGSTIALVGESGSGKSTIAQAIMGILPKVARISGGEVILHDSRDGCPDVDIAKLKRDGAAMRAIRGGQVSIIFQEPMTSLSQLYTVGNQVGEALHLHRDVNRATGRELTIETLRLVGFPDPASAYKSYPFELSGGMKQRVAIAIGTSLSPSVIIADEPTSALDVVVQRQVMETLRSVQEEIGAAVLIVGHDMGLMAQFADRMGVMYAGKLAELGPVKDLFANPQHPYTKLLIESVPTIKAKRSLVGIPGAPPALINVPPGCPFHPRCPSVFEPCDRDVPATISHGGRWVACHLYEHETA